MTVRAIETRYAGCRFRSRLEARWAVTLTKLRIEWQYEPQGFEIDGTPYLPDFYFPRTHTWVEVKGTDDDINGNLKLFAVATAGALPHTANSWGTAAGLLILGPIPTLEYDAPLPTHTLLQHEEASGVHRSWATLTPGFGVQVVGTANESTWPPLLPDSRVIPFTAAGSFLDDKVKRSVVRAYTAGREARFEHGQNG